MNQPHIVLGCVIMASGLGRRFGANKLLAEFDGAPMFLRALDATEGVFARRIVVTRHEEVAALCRARGVDVLLHALPHRSDTVQLGLTRLLEEEPHLAGCAFCPADQPLLTRESVLALAQSFESDPAGIHRLSSRGRPGSPMLFDRAFFPALLSLPEGKGGSYLAKAQPEAVRPVPVADESELDDADTPEALESLLAKYHIRSKSEA